MKKNDRKDKFVYTKDDIKGIKLIKPNKKVKESYKSFAEFLFEKEEVPFNDKTMRWITIKDKDMQNQHILIKKKDGTVLAGMGGEHTGEKLKDVFKDLEDEREQLDKKSSQKKSYDKKEIEQYVASFIKESIPEEKQIHTELSIVSDNLSLDEYNALQEYTSTHYFGINKILRDPEYTKDYPHIYTDDVKTYYNTIIKNCHNALKKYKTSSNVVSYRGIPSDIIEEKWRDIEPGDIIADDAFVSTTTKQSVANSFSHDGYIMTVLIPKGSHAASVKKLSKNGPENEVLIDKKARFEVKSLDHNRKEMIVELLPHEDD